MSMLCLLLAVSFEAAAAPAAFTVLHDGWQLLGALLLHGLGSWLLALAMARAMPMPYQEPRRWLVSYLAAFNFFMPIVGVLCVMLSFVVSRRMPAQQGEESFCLVRPPRFTAHHNREGTGFRGGQAREQLVNVRTPLGSKMKALVAIQDAPARKTSDLLRTLLADPADDIRLLAFTIMNSKEKRITQRILDKQQQLEKAAGDAVRHRLHKQLAELNWELIFQNLVQGDLRAFTADQVRQHAAQALQLCDDAGLWFLLARLELRFLRADAAEQALVRAEQAHFTRMRLLPYLAEIRFLQRRFDAVRALMSEMALCAPVGQLAPAMRFWTVIPRNASELLQLPAHPSNSLQLLS